MFEAKIFDSKLSYNLEQNYNFGVPLLLIPLTHTYPYNLPKKCRLLNVLELIRIY